MKNKAVLVIAAALCVIAVCLAVLLIPSVRAHLDLATAREEAQQVSSEAESKAPDDLTYQVKLAGTALCIYASDYDDRMPPKGSDLREALAPYTKDDTARIFAPWQNPVTGDESTGFVYTYAGSEALKKDDIGLYPGDIVLGYKEYQSGRATVYANGRAAWETRSK